MEKISSLISVKEIKKTLSKNLADGVDTNRKSTIKWVAKKGLKDVAQAILDEINKNFEEEK